ncbi:hypothetical protein [Streptomyces albidoflavus]|uniref:hypothetical protein n=1 Tax=Streptomyces albidoflavus TaxID=1886 RepID=UPI00308C8231|nr:hypothetical protein OG919_24010 [Streptomyces albidoflavus]
MNITPGPGFMSDVTVCSGLHHTMNGTTAQLLLTHTPPRLAHETLETVEAGMRALAVCLHLGPVDEQPRFIGRRLSLARGIVSLDYGDDRWVFRVPGASWEWQQTVAEGADVRLLLSFRPAPTGRTQADMSAYLDECVRDGMVRWGTTRARRPF